MLLSPSAFISYSGTALALTQAQVSTSNALSAQKTQKKMQKSGLSTLKLWRVLGFTLLLLYSYPVSSVRNGPIWRYTKPEVLFIPEFHTGTHQYIL
jgi:hypothetical protein